MLEILLYATGAWLILKYAAGNTGTVVSPPGSGADAASAAEVQSQAEAAAEVAEAYSGQRALAAQGWLGNLISGVWSEWHLVKAGSGGSLQGPFPPGTGVGSYQDMILGTVVSGPTGTWLLTQGEPMYVGGPLPGKWVLQ